MVGRGVWVWGVFMKSEGRKVYGRAEMVWWKLHRLHNTA